MSMPRLMEKYRAEVLPALCEKAGTKNPMAVPRLEKIVVSMGLGVAIGTQGEFFFTQLFLRPAE